MFRYYVMRSTGLQYCLKQGSAPSKISDSNQLKNMFLARFVDRKDITDIDEFKNITLKNKKKNLFTREIEIN